MWRVLEPRMEGTRRDLAKDFGCDPEEMAVVRNASEALENMIFGIDLKKRRRGRSSRTRTTAANDHDWQQRVRREGIVLKQISLQGAAAER